MKNALFIVFVLILLSFALGSNAQQKVWSTQPFADTSVLRIPSPQLTYKGNHNHFDIYTATPDNMYVIKPDSTVHFNMPTGRYRIMQTPVKKSNKNDQPLK